jgi:hypothetical protein
MEVVRFEFCFAFSSVVDTGNDLQDNQSWLKLNVS